MKSKFVPKSEAYGVVYKLDAAEELIESLWKSRGFSKEELVYWNKKSNLIKGIADSIAREYKK